MVTCPNCQKGNNPLPNMRRAGRMKCKHCGMDVPLTAALVADPPAVAPKPEVGDVAKGKWSEELEGLRNAGHDIVFEIPARPEKGDDERPEFDLY